jgi:hypothetical protein
LRRSQPNGDDGSHTRAGEKIDRNFCCFGADHDADDAPFDRADESSERASQWPFWMVKQERRGVGRGEVTHGGFEGRYERFGGAACDLVCGVCMEVPDHEHLRAATGRNGRVPGPADLDDHVSDSAYASGVTFEREGTSRIVIACSARAASTALESFRMLRVPGALRSRSPKSMRRGGPVVSDASVWA